MLIRTYRGIFRSCHIIRICFVLSSGPTLWSSSGQVLWSSFPIVVPGRENVGMDGGGSRLDRENITVSYPILFVSSGKCPVKLNRSIAHHYMAV